MQQETSVVYYNKEVSVPRPPKIQGSTKVNLRHIQQSSINANQQKHEMVDNGLSATVFNGIQEKGHEESDVCPPSSTFDPRKVEVCGGWIRTCPRDCMCEKKESIVQIPRIVHFIKDGNLTFSDWLAVVAAEKYIKPIKINLYTREDVLPNCWMRRLHLINHVNRIELTAGQWLENLNNVTVSRIEHQSDLLRNALLFHYGGVYMDTDAIATKSFDALLANHSIVLGQNLVNRTGNGLIIARRRSCLICDYASQACDKFDGSWTKHSTSSLSSLVKNSGTKYNLLLLDNNTGFFPFSWKEEHFNQLVDVNSTQIPFSPTQAYALHLFGSKFSEEIYERFGNLTWINESPSVLASHVRTLINSQLLKPDHLNETLCEELPPNLLG